jgi:hypothetical protein
MALADFLHDFEKEIAGMRCAEKGTGAEGNWW